MSGKEHIQTSGCSVCWKFIILFLQCSYIKNEDFIKKRNKDYISHDMPLHSCGAYKFESKGYLLFSEVIGDQFTIQGLPFLQITKLFI